MVYQWTANFFDPLLTSDGQPYHIAKFKEIVSEQTILGYLTKGGVSFTDSNNMTPYERRLATDAIREFLEAQNEAQKEAIENAQKQRIKMNK